MLYFTHEKYVCIGVYVYVFRLTRKQKTIFNLDKVTLVKSISDR